jgi:hypothetical protein
LAVGVMLELHTPLGFICLVNSFLADQIDLRIEECDRTNWHCFIDNLRVCSLRMRPSSQSRRDCVFFFRLNSSKIWHTWITWDRSDKHLRSIFGKFWNKSFNWRLIVMRGIDYVNWSIFKYVRTLTLPCLISSYIHIFFIVMNSFFTAFR